MNEAAEAMLECGIHKARRTNPHDMEGLCDILEGFSELGSDDFVVIDCAFRLAKVLQTHVFGNLRFRDYLLSNPLVMLKFIEHSSAKRLRQQLQCCT